MKKVQLAIIIVLLCWSSKMNAQVEYSDATVLGYKVDNNTFIFDGKLDLSVKDFLTRHRHLLNISAGDSLVLDDVESDTTMPETKTIFHTIKFHQIHKGLPVDRATVRFSEKDLIVHSFMGNLVKNIPGNISTVPTIGNEESLGIALYELRQQGVDTFMWENEEEEQDIKESTGDPNATYYPKPGVLTYTYTNDYFDGANYKLAWKYIVESYLPFESYEVIINANNGSVIRITPLRVYCGQTGTCNILYYGTKNIMTHYRNGLFSNDYILKDCTSGYSEIHTKWNTKVGLLSGKEITDNDNNWGNDDMNGTTSHWSAMKVRDYYKTEFSRNSFDNKGTVLKLAVGVNTSAGENASFSGSNGIMELGTRATDAFSFGRLDIVGHEFTHGVSYSTAEFTKGWVNNGYEPYALDESFADIFGVLAEYHVLGTVNWEIGEGLTTESPLPAHKTGARNLADPHLSGNPCPKYYHGQYWYYGYDNVRAAHFNAGVQNHWFYKLANSAAIYHAAYISYRNLTTKLNNQSDFAHSRIGSVQAAKEMYGQCSPIVNKTIQAWSEVGVGSGSSDINCVSITGPAKYCTSWIGKTINLTYKATSTHPVTSYTWWGIPGSVQYTTNGDKLTITKINTTNNFDIWVTAYYPDGSYTDKKFTVKRTSLCKDDGTIAASVDAHAQSRFRLANNTEEEDVAIEIYPNPADNNIHINADDEEATVTLRDMQGRKMKTVQGNNILILDVSELAAGIYMVEVSTPVKHRVKKITISH